MWCTGYRFHDLHGWTEKRSLKNVLLKRVQRSRKGNTQLLLQILRRLPAPSELSSVHRRLGMQGKYTWPHFQQSSLHRHSGHISGQSSKLYSQLILTTKIKTICVYMHKKLKREILQQLLNHKSGTLKETLEVRFTDILTLILVANS